jgi:hypothetical protein
MAWRKGFLTTFLLFAAVFCADALILARWLTQPSAMSALPLLGYAFAALNLLGLVLLGRVLLMSARVLYAQRKAAHKNARVAPGLRPGEDGSETRPHTIS